MAIDPRESVTRDEDDWQGFNGGGSAIGRGQVDESSWVRRALVPRFFPEDIIFFPFCFITILGGIWEPRACR